MDRISDLPGELIRSIVGFLPANDAARVLVLKRRFRNLYTIIPNLEFDDEKDEFQGTFTDYVTESLALLDTITCIRRFSLKSQSYLIFDHISHWLREVLKLSVMDLELDLAGCRRELPLEIFSCNTVVKMKLGKRFELTVIPKNALFPSLESLFLDTDVRFCAPENGDCVFEAFLLACPVLKELIITEMQWEKWNWSRILSSKSLQRLTMWRVLSDDFSEDGPQRLSFDIPSLAYFEYGDFVLDEYPIVEFGSLVEAKLTLLVMEPCSSVDVDSNPANLFQGIKNVEILDLGCPLTCEVFYLFHEAIPVFKNLHRLSFTHNNMGVCWRFLPFLLEKTPNLNTIVIEGGLHYVGGPAYVCDCVSGYSCLLSCRVEVMEVTLWEQETIEELQQVKHFLGKLPCLELLIVNTSQWTSNKEKLRIIKDLRRFPRASSKCRVEFRCIV